MFRGFGFRVLGFGVLGFGVPFRIRIPSRQFYIGSLVFLGSLRKPGFEGYFGC